MSDAGCSLAAAVWEETGGARVRKHVLTSAKNANGTNLELLIAA